MIFLRQDPEGADGFALAETETEHVENALLLFPEYDGTDATPRPVIDAYAGRFHVILNLKCDDMLRDWLDAVASAHAVSRSEIMRRLLMAAMDDLQGEIVPVFDQPSLPLSLVARAA